MEDVAYTKTYAMLINKNWKEVSIEVFGADDNLNKDITHQFMKSDLDDIILFNDNGTYLFDEGRSKARNESSQVYDNGTWTFDHYTNSLELLSHEIYTTYQLIKISNETLILKLEIPSKNYFYLITYQATEN